MKKVFLVLAALSIVLSFCLVMIGIFYGPGFYSIAGLVGIGTGIPLFSALKSKKLFVTLFILTATAGFSQIEVIPTKNTIIGSFKNGSYTQAELTQKDSTYCLTYLNLRYQILDDYRTICFTGDIKELEKMVLFSFDKEMNIKLGNENVRLYKAGSSVRFETPGGFFYMTRKQVSKLFGGQNGDKIE